MHSMLECCQELHGIALLMLILVPFDHASEENDLTRIIEKQSSSSMSLRATNTLLLGDSG